jgi:hypothetical protein
MLQLNFLGQPSLHLALGLALRKRFCVPFHFERQAAGSHDAILLSLGSVSFRSSACPSSSRRAGIMIAFCPRLPILGHSRSDVVVEVAQRHQPLHVQLHRPTDAGSTPIAERRPPRESRSLVESCPK